MKSISARMGVPLVATALLLGSSALALADDAGAHDFLLSGSSPRVSTDNAATVEPAPTTSAIVAPRRTRAIGLRAMAVKAPRHVAAKPTRSKVAQHREMKGPQPMHARYRDLKDQKAPSSS